MTVGDSKYLDIDPRHHTAAVATMLHEVDVRVVEGIDHVDEPRAQALLTMTREVLCALTFALTAYEQRGYSEEPTAAAHPAN